MASFWLVTSCEQGLMWHVRGYISSLIEYCLKDDGCHLDIQLSGDPPHQETSLFYEDVDSIPKIFKI